MVVLNIVVLNGGSRWLCVIDSLLEDIETAVCFPFSAAVALLCAPALDAGTGSSAHPSRSAKRSKGKAPKVSKKANVPGSKHAGSNRKNGKHKNPKTRTRHSHPSQPK